MIRTNKKTKKYQIYTSCSDNNFLNNVIRGSDDVAAYVDLFCSQLLTINTTKKTYQNIVTFLNEVSDYPTHGSIFSMKNDKFDSMMSLITTNMNKDDYKIFAMPNKRDKCCMFMNDEAVMAFKLLWE